jgi:hypothetical protein
LLFASYDVVFDMKLIEACAREVKALEPSRLRLAAAMQRLRNPNLEVASKSDVPTLWAILAAIDNVTEDEMHEASHLRLAWHGDSGLNHSLTVGRAKSKPRT